jgi:integrase
MLADGIDANAVRKAERQARADRGAGSFELVAREWHARQAGSWGEVHAVNVLRRLVLDVFPRIGDRPISDLRGPHLLEVLRAIEARGTQATSLRRA